MDATRWMPRAGAAVLGVFLVALAVPAGASAVSVVGHSGGGTSPITYTDPAGIDDNVSVEVGQDSNQNQAFAFIPATPGSLTNDSGCTFNTSSVLVCPIQAGTIVFQLAGGSDLVDLRQLAEPHAPPSQVSGGAGNDELRGSPDADDFAGDAGEDRLVGLTGADRFAGGAGTDTLDLRVGGPWVVTLDGIINDGPGGAANVGTDVEVILGGPAGDQLTGGPGPNTLAGGGGADTIAARDGAVDAISCGDGADTVTADWNDAVDNDCETVDRSVRDDDGDGSANGVDCNDGNPAIKPGAGDVPGNGVDDDCDGSDAVLDRDGDGAAAGADCDDADPNRRPGARDVPANGVDEDCSGSDAQRPVADPKVSTGWSVFARWTTITKLAISDAPAGAKLSVRCSGNGCPFKRKSVRLRRGGATLTKLFKGKRLRPGAVIELRITAPEMVGAVRRIVIRKRKEPKRRELCLPPGASKPTRC